MGSSTTARRKVTDSLWFEFLQNRQSAKASAISSILLAYSP